MSRRIELMKKTGTIIAMASILFVITSCDSRKDIAKQLATDFANAVVAGDSATILRIYPDVAKADSLVKCFDLSKLDVTENETDKSLLVQLGENIDATIQEDNEGNMKIVNTHGVFAFPSGVMKFAHATGWVPDSLSDSQVVEQLKDEEFLYYVKDIFEAQFYEQFNISFVTDNRYKYGSDLSGGGDWTITIQNRTNYDVMGADYQIKVVSQIRKSLSRVLEGKDVYANSEAQITTFLDGSWYFYYNLYDVGPDPLFTIEWNKPLVETLCQYYTPTGNEYQNYQRSK
jgi:hypothetical protein